MGAVCARHLFILYIKTRTTCKVCNCSRVALSALGNKVKLQRRMHNIQMSVARNRNCITVPLSYDTLFVLLLGIADARKVIRASYVSYSIGCWGCVIDCSLGNWRNTRDFLINTSCSKWYTPRTSQRIIIGVWWSDRVLAKLIEMH
jgi:hypothetical protein